MRPPAGVHQLWRQDDNGQRFLIGCFLTHGEAEARLAELSRCPHKQIYWIVAGDQTPAIDDPQTQGD